MVEGSLKSLVLIRAKHLAESVTTPTFIADREGTLIFYNEAAEALLGHRFADHGPLDPTRWGELFNVRSRDDSPFPLEAMPGWLEVQRHRPNLGHLKFSTASGDDRVVAVCTVPLFTSQERFEGAIVIFWEDGG